MVLLTLPGAIVLVHTNTINQEGQVKIDPKVINTLASDTSSQIPVLLQFRDGTSPEEIRSILGQYNIPGLEIRRIFHIAPLVSAYVRGGIPNALKRMSSLLRIAYDGKQQFLPLPASINIDQPMAPSNNSEFSDDILDAKSVWTQGYNGSGVTVAIIDTGAMGDHPDLADRIIGFKDYVNNLDDMNPSDGIDAYDDNGHGTACAWLIAGSGKQMGYNHSGVAPGAKLLVIKALDDQGSAQSSIFDSAIEFAVDHGADVISISVGGTWTDDPYFVDTSIATVKGAVMAGVAVVIAAGNDGPSTTTIASPGVTLKAITVGASVNNQGVADFSSRGPVVYTYTNPHGVFAKPDILAPGYRVPTARWTGSSQYEYPSDSQLGSYYTRFSGTSAATPQIAGLVALLKDKDSNLSPLRAKIVLMKGATDLHLDAMSQGYGVANASKAIELLDQGAMTIMTPLRFPTLPGGSRAFVIGENREPQNITVLSDVARGPLKVSIIGNASAYVVTNTSSVNVGAGYSFFDIGLRISQELPLSAIGQYTGELRLLDGPTTIATMQLEFEITNYRGSLLVDSSHHSALDPDTPDSYRYFGEYLREQGMIMEELGSVDRPETITLEKLSAHESFMIMDTELAYSQQEIDDIIQFVHDGGTLLILSEYYNQSSQIASFGIDSYNQVLQPFGIQCERNGIGKGPGGQGVVYGVDHGGSVVSDPLTEGVSNLYILYGSTFHVDPSVSGARGLFWVDAAKQHAILAYAEYGEGKVIAISDGSTLYDTIVYDAIRGNADNLNLLRNVAHALKSEKPTILNIVVNGGHIGGKGNITAYVFDDDLENVTMTLTLPNGTVMETQITEELGYKFTSKFNIDSAGLYVVTVTATDALGNAKTVVKSFIVPVRPIDDQILTTTLIVLLGVIGVSLGYVGIKRIVKGRHERHWEPQWEDEKPAISPPEIE